MLDRIYARIGCDSNSLILDSVSGYLLADAMRLFDDHFHLFQRYKPWPRIDDNLDTIRAIIDCLADRAPRFLDAAYYDIFLVDDLLRVHLQSAKLPSRSCQRPCRDNHSRPDDPAASYGITQSHVAVQAGIAQITHGRDACLEVFPAHGRTQQRPLCRAHLGYSQNHVVVVAPERAIIVLQKM